MAGVGGRPLRGQRIRHYGFLANGNRQAKLARIRELLPHLRQGESTPQDAAETATEPECAAAPTTDDVWRSWRHSTGEDISTICLSCPRCSTTAVSACL